MLNTPVNLIVDDLFEKNINLISILLDNSEKIRKSY